MRQTSCNEICACSCGSDRVRAEHKDGVCIVICHDCGACGTAYPTELQAVRSWNKKNKGRKGDSANE